MKRSAGFLFLCMAVCASRVVFALDFTGLTGSGAAVPNLQPSLTMTYMIRTEFSSYYSLGEVGLFAGTFLPGGWTAADGRLLDIDSHPLLYDALGTTYGGDGSATFALPDLRGRAVFGTGTGSGLSSRTLGASFGAEQVALTNGQLPAHRHSLPQGGTTGPVGIGQSQLNVQPGLALNFGLRAFGVFPTGGSGLPYDGGYLGQIDVFAGQSLPPEDVSADGRLLPKNQNTALFALLGTTYGGDGTNSFAVPDLRGRVAIHEGQSAGLAERTLGEATGSEQVVLTASQLPAHNHSLPNSTTATTGTTGGNALQPNMGPSLTVNYIIATSGLDPSSQSGSDGTFMGQLRLFAGNFAPTGFAFADGQLLSVGDYPELFSVLGSTYGGDGAETFALPDLRGRVPIDVGSGPGLTSRTLGSISGAEAVALSVANLPSHAHAVSVPGDFSLNGVVDAADYVLWRDGLGTTYTQSDYNLWQAHFGERLQSGSGADDEQFPAVPEPATAVIVLTELSLVLTYDCRRSHGS
ncbi:MAG: phage tail protein [Pirellulales bacterium]